MSLQVLNSTLQRSRMSVNNKILTSGGSVVASGMSDGEPVDLDGGGDGIDEDGNYSTVYGHFNFIPQSDGFVKVQYLTGNISIVPVWEGKEVMGSFAKIIGDGDTTVREFYAFI